MVLKQGTMDRFKTSCLKITAACQKRLDSVEAGALLLNITLRF
jgi:hypothetical protein